MHNCETMILVLGGTTEGRKAVEVLEEGGEAQGNSYYYSTKTGEQDVTLHHGQRIDGALDRDAMLSFCREHDIRLLVDAAHPFASQLHTTVASVAETLDIPVIRFERIFPPRDPDITWIDDYSELSSLLPPRSSLLATTGVQSIGKLKPLEDKGIRMMYRILNRESSIALAQKQGAKMEQLCFFDDANDIPVRADAILLKESGLSGGFPEKVEAAKARGMSIIALKRPELPITNGRWSMVNGPYGLRRAVEKLLPAFFPLHSGLTTGTCATAAAIAATLQLLHSPLSTPHSPLPKEVPVILPDGETINVPVGYGDGYAYCTKEAGDDPDVTNGITIECRPTPILPASEGVVSVVNGGLSVRVYAGAGIGRFTLPGFDFPPGEPAINRGPRKMLAENLQLLLDSIPLPHGKEIGLLLVIPEGAEIARRTFNPRLGIEDGISIIGVSGIVKPFSEEAFIQSIHKCMEVAQASGTERVVINSGAKSERFVKARYPSLPAQAFVEYGNYIGETLKIAHELNIPNVTLGVMLGKAVKLAAGHLDTHSRKSVMDKEFIQQMLDEAHSQVSILNSPLSLARELWEKIPPEKLKDFAHTIIRHCEEHCLPILPNGNLTILLIDDEGNIYE